MYEIFEKLCGERGITPYKFCKDTGIRTSTISTWKKNKSLIGPRLAKKICEYFNVSFTFLMTGKEDSEEKESKLTARDQRDIAKDLDRIMDKLISGEDGPASYDGEELSPESAELFRGELEIALKRLKLLNKEKYTPKKYKK